MSNSNDVKPVVWIGDSLKQVKGFPEEVRRAIGSSLYDAQLGDKPNSAKPFKGVGRGIFEIVTRFDSDTYRTVYAVQISNCIYVLHAFEKKSTKGIKTAQKDVDLIKNDIKRRLSNHRRINDE